MTRADELEKFKDSIYLYENRKLRKIDLLTLSGHTFCELHDIHHYIRQQEYKRNPDKYKDTQKLFLIPRDMHSDIHSYNSKFKEKYGIELDKLIYRS